MTTPNPQLNADELEAQWKHAFMQRVLGRFGNGPSTAAVLRCEQEAQTAWAASPWSTVLAQWKGSFTAELESCDFDPEDGNGGTLLIFRTWTDRPFGAGTYRIGSPR